MCRFIFLVLSLVLLPAPSFAQGMLNLPFSPPPERYGDVLMERTSKDKNVPSVVFSHWIHRVKYTCKVCHYELEFSMKPNDSAVVCDNGRMNGRYCASCHDGKTAFGPRDADGENCSLCHTGGKGSSWSRFSELLERLPRSKYGNEINWTKALDEGYIKPKHTLSGETAEIVHSKTLTLKAEMGGISSAVFPHKTHEQWLDCSSCHPELFNIKMKSTATLRMANMVKGQSCGVCHVSVAFPLDDCRKCHPAMKVR